MHLREEAPREGSETGSRGRAAFETQFRVFHLFENHEHEVCYEQTTHLHKDAPECHTCDFYSSSFQYILPENYLSTLTLLPQNKEVAITVAPLFSKKLTSKQLRAPPSILS